VERPSCLYITTVWPEWTSSAAGVRTRFIAETLRDAGYRVIVQCSAVDTPFRGQLEALGFETRYQPINESSFDQWIQTTAPTLVIYDRFVIEEQFGSRIRQHAPRAIHVLDTQDVHFLRRYREKIAKKGQWQDLEHESDECALNHLRQQNWSTQVDALREIGSILRCDLSLIVSEFELNLLQGAPFFVPTERLLLNRWAAEPLASDQVPSWDNREGLVMIGNYRHPPNLDGVLWFHREVWPVLKKISQGTLPRVHIYGAYAPREVSALHQPEDGIVFHGWAASESDALARAKINLAPLRFGAGIKGKILEGWRVGLPCVGTRIASEGMCGDLPFGGRIAHSAESFAQAIHELYSIDTSAYQQASEAGMQILKKYYLPEVIVPALLSRIQQIRENLGNVRKQNFIGSLLSHDSHARTKYFSAWIEAKNLSKVPVSKEDKPAPGIEVVAPSPDVQSEVEQRRSSNDDQ